MSTMLIFFITIHLIALVYFFEQLRRIHLRSSEYSLKEDRFSLPLGFVRLRHVIALYILCYFLWVIGSVVLYLVFIDPSSVPAEVSTRILHLDF